MVFVESWKRSEHAQGLESGLRGITDTHVGHDVSGRENVGYIDLTLIVFRYIIYSSGYIKLSFLCNVSVVA